MNNHLWDHILHQFELPLINPVLIFALILFIILLSPILMGKIRIPGLVGFIIAGIIVGPYGFNLLKKTSAVDLFSTIGLLYIMFIAGIELDLAEFKKKKHKSFVFGFLTFAIPILIGLPVCYYLLHYSLLTSILTSSMFATHTLVAYPIVSKYGIFKNEAVAVAVGGTILTDTAVLIILAVIMSANSGGLSTAFWIELIVSLAVFTLIMFLVIPRIARWFFTRLESEKTSHYVFVLSVVFFSAFLAQLAGVEPIIGAFIAGLALNKLIPNTSMLMNRIEFVGNAIFIPFFLISVGMLVDLRVLFRGPEAIIVAVTLTVVALLGKYLAAISVQKIFRYSAAQRGLVFGLSSSHAAATLAIILVGYKARIIDDNILNGTIILILVTCVVASFATERASKKIVLSGGNSNANEQLQEDEPESILVPIADFTRMETLLDLAVLLKNKNSENPITVLSVVPNTAHARVNLHKAHKQLQESEKYISANGTLVDMVATLDYNIYSGMIRTAKEKMANIIITGWPRKVNFIDQFLGNKTQRLVKHADAHLFVCQLNRPLALHGSIHLICPPTILLELSNNLWLSKICKLSVELGLELNCYCTGSQEAYIKKYLKDDQFSININYADSAVWEDYRMLALRTNENDLLVMVMERRKKAALLNTKNALYRKIEQAFDEQSKMLIYPQTIGIGS